MVGPLVAAWEPLFCLSDPVILAAEHEILAGNDLICGFGLRTSPKWEYCFFRVTALKHPMMGCLMKGDYNILMVVGQVQRMSSTYTTVKRRKRDSRRNVIFFSYGA
jgi:hypothetical protein